MKFEFLRSDWVGIGIGSVMGLYQGIVVFDSEIGRGLENAAILPVVLFGLFGPPILALLNRFLPMPMPGTYRAIGKYVNTIFLMVAFGIFTGLSGFTYYWLVGGPDSVLFLLSFFSSAGVGFFFAYLIYPELAFRPESNA
ncbi:MULTISPECIES: hypothetical protein [unclassified Pseudoalteromonas]|uniref:hypothetical protein n=1 Tax=unclassified Pseudoalteromonas TaxID=194690 RepID=UPI000CF6A0A7|nr:MULTISPECIES: hypothetical protein [unclassified Pseudoalteromonas]